MKIHSSWLFLTLPAFAIAAVLLTASIRSLLRVLRDAAVASLPVESEQALTLRAAGDYTLSVEGRFASTDFGGVTFSLADERGASVPTERVLLRTTVSSFSRTRLEIERFRIATPGTYSLRTTGIHAGADPDDRVVVGRAVGAAMALGIIAIVLCGVVTIGSLVASALLIVLPGRATRV